MLIGLLLCGCTSDPGLDETASDNDREATEKPGIGGDVYNLSLRFATPPNSSSRGDDDKWEFEDGKEAENYIREISLYFFQASGEIVKVRKGDDADAEYSDFYKIDMTATAETLSRANNVEKTETVDVCLGFEGSRPDRLIAIINPPAQQATYQIGDLSDLQEVAGDFKTNYTSKGYFVMSSSTYVETREETRETVCWVNLEEENFSTLGNAPTPVSIYVERVLARIDISVEPENSRIEKGGETLYDTGITISPIDDETNQKKVYVKFLGWAPTSSPTTSRLIKNVSAAWKDEDMERLENEWWNSPQNYRCYWAINPTSVEYDWYSYGDLSGEGMAGGRNENCYSMSTVSAYLQENANPFTYTDEVLKPSNPTYPTKVIFACQYVDGDNNPLTIVEYDSKNYTLEGLKTIIANTLDDLYTLTEDGDEDLTLGARKYRKILPADLDLETSRQHGNEYGPEAEGTYYVYFCLKSTAREREWYLKSDLSAETDSSKMLTQERLQKYIDDYTFPVKVWEDGYTYYYFDIPHFYAVGDTPGALGVVRNHIYNATIVKITSLGTPVYKPDEVIYPEKPATGGNQLEVIVKTIEWRMVSQDLQLAW